MDMIKGVRGITPAWAGKSGSGLLFHRVWWEHPRVGGEKQHFPAVLGIILGSPPHGRGKVAGPGVALLHPGITPAWAGKRSCKEIAPLLVEDHPRVGGEKFTSGTMYFEDRGSPPRGRGKDSGTVHGCGQLRITPAWAGKRWGRCADTGADRDHPRVGGEKHLSGTTDNRPQGSPPRGRGKDVLPCGKVNSSRITPARAGKKCISA